MGWSFGCASRREQIDELTAPWATGDGGTVVTLRRATVGNTLWTVHERQGGPDYPNASRRWIGCALIRRGGPGDWGYKGMSESMHPYYYSCPLAYLDLVPVACAEWREKVRAYHARRAAVRTARPGDRLVLVAGCKPAEVVVEEVRRGGSVVGRAPNGLRVRVAAKFVERVESASAGAVAP